MVTLTMDGYSFTFPSIHFVPLFILTIFLFFTSSSSAALQYQSLVVKSLPKPQSLSWLTQEEDLQENIQTVTIPESETGSNSSNTNAFSVVLHHVDSLPSLFYNTTAEVLFQHRLRRDAYRAKSISSLVSAVSVKTNRIGVKATAQNLRGRTGFSSSVVSGLSQGSGEYFTRLGIGTPPKYAYMVLDTGSDVIWVQCYPCRKCYKQSDPVFNPSQSSSFRGVSCDSQPCRRLDSAKCDKRKMCLYQVSYGDRSFTFGEFSTETLTFRRTRVTNVSLGCGHYNEGLFVGAAGLLGLGRGKLSFPSQAGRRFGRKFSYCLVDRSASKPSSIIFGNAAVSRKANFTTLLTNPRLDTFYYLGLNGISVGGFRVRGITESLFKLDSSGNGGVIIDSGTSVTRLTQPAYNALRDAFLEGASNLKRALTFSLFDTCFDLAEQTEVKVPTLDLHFTKADVSLPASNYLVPVDSEGTFCFAFAGTTSGLSIIGNIQQQGFRVVFDLAGSRIGFAPQGCA